MPINVQHVEEPEIASGTLERISVRRRGNCWHTLQLFLNGLVMSRDARFLLNSRGRTSVIIVIISMRSHSRAELEAPADSLHESNREQFRSEISLLDVEPLINFAGTLFNIFYVNSKPSTLLSQSYF